MKTTQYKIGGKYSEITLYIVQEFAKGRSLRDLNRETGVSLPTLIKIRRDNLQFIEKFENVATLKEILDDLKEGGKED